MRQLIRVVLAACVFGTGPFVSTAQADESFADAPSGVNEIVGQIKKLQFAAENRQSDLPADYQECTMRPPNKTNSDLAGSAATCNLYKDPVHVLNSQRVFNLLLEVQYADCRFCLDGGTVNVTISAPADGLGKYYRNVLGNYWSGKGFPDQNLNLNLSDTAIKEIKAALKDTTGSGSDRLLSVTPHKFEIPWDAAVYTDACEGCKVMPAAKKATPVRTRAEACAAAFRPFNPCNGG